MILFFALLFVAIAVAGFCALLIFWPLTLVHVRDRHPALSERFGAGAWMSPDALGWLLSRRYRETGDPSLTGLATPAWLSLMTIFVGLLMAGLLWLGSLVPALGG
ncbi:hypothetical protein CSC70_07995 [Pseudoxanthomonas kalamensis DSM 18571]|uniref:hypothetical protein n=1 Tax=Pseudoxanthomonas kalamensis TaxID=289483 RepID=UPI0013912DE8|nr:hypothetical protein [Pseudoxanthomonas kalamensis]KAF1710591.1 hypothetical protein CSC70_07995 [Pseudoxanthomonas kalamensis DSM 18571]